MFWKKKKEDNNGIEFAIIGLGNPGKDFESTRHNMGFMVLDILSQKCDIKVNKIKHKSLCGVGMIEGHKAILVKPQTYMNLSGEAVREVLKYYKIDIEKLIIIYDDIDINLGEIRIRKKGSAGTHNGMKNIIYQISDDNFPRIRVGIGDREKGSLRDYVIGAVSKNEAEKLNPIFEKCADAAISIISDGIDKAMNEYNVKNKKVGEEKNDR